MKKTSINPDDEYEINQSAGELLLQSEAENKYDGYLSFKELYSFSTFKELYENNKLLTSRTK